MILLRWIANSLAPLTLAGAILAYFLPQTFLVFRQSFLWFFAATMLALGVVLEPEDLWKTLKEPGPVCLGVLTQYSVMPLLGYAVARFGGLGPELALGFIIVGCAPGAMASNVIVFLAGGAVAYSVALTTVATALSPVITPALVKFFGGVLMPIPFRPMMQTIFFIVLVPLIIGILLHRILGKYLDAARQMAPALATVAIVVICGYAVASNQARVTGVGFKVFSLVVLLNALGYASGWALAGFYRFDPGHQRALCIEIGMQNAGLGVALALKHFSPEAALPGTLFAVWCILTSAGATAWFRIHERYRKNNKLRYYA